MRVSPMAAQRYCSVEDVGSVKGRRVVLWSGQVVADTGGQRGTRVNTSHDRVLLLPIRKYTCYCPP